MIVPLYLSEISSDRQLVFFVDMINYRQIKSQFDIHSVRGFLVSTLVLSENVGMLLAFVIGNSFEYPAIPIFSIVLLTLFAILLYFIPESPLFLLKQDKIKVSERTLSNIQNACYRLKYYSNRKQKIRYDSSKTYERPMIPKFLSQR